QLQQERGHERLVVGVERDDDSQGRGVKPPLFPFLVCAARPPYRGPPFPPPTASRYARSGAARSGRLTAKYPTAFRKPCLLPVPGRTPSISQAYTLRLASRRRRPLVSWISPCTLPDRTAAASSTRASKMSGVRT